jgi:RND family efflux transporter MFP subunit
MKNLLLVLSIYAVVALTACSKNHSNKTNGEEKFIVTNPIIADTTFNQEYVADIQAIQNVELRARVKGFLDKIYVDEGELVKEGQTLFSLTNREYEEEVLKAKALLKVAQAEVRIAELEVLNTKKLVDKNVVSKTELDLAEAKLEALEAKVDEAKANLSNAQTNLSYTIIKAPFSGVINRIPNKKGSLIDEGMLLTTISNDKEVFVYFNVSEKEYLDYMKEEATNKHDKAVLILANNEVYGYKGIVETIESEIDRSTGNLAFRARFPNDDKLLKHGSSGKILLPKILNKAMLIPQKSTFEVQENVYVYVVDENNIVHTRRIIPALRLPHLYVVESGLNVKDRIVYEGIQRIKEGDKIVPEMVSQNDLLVKK